MEAMELNDIAEMLCRNLISEGFIIQRYDAYSSNSIYLKLDYGVCNSIRISDHPGKKYLKYRYNIGPYVKEFQEVKDKFPRIYYREAKRQSLLKRIIRDTMINIWNLVLSHLTHLKIFVICTNRITN